MYRTTTEVVMETSTVEKPKFNWERLFERIFGSSIVLGTVAFILFFAALFVHDVYYGLSTNKCTSHVDPLIVQVLSTACLSAFFLSAVGFGILGIRFGVRVAKGERF